MSTLYGCYLVALCLSTSSESIIVAEGMKSVRKLDASKRPNIHRIIPRKLDAVRRFWTISFLQFVRGKRQFYLHFDTDSVEKHTHIAIFISFEFEITTAHVNPSQYAIYCSDANELIWKKKCWHLLCYFFHILNICWSNRVHGFHVFRFVFRLHWKQPFD